jgi:hypothetical protein
MVVGEVFVREGHMFRCHIENDIIRICEVEMIVFIVFYINEKTSGKAMHAHAYTQYDKGQLSGGWIFYFLLAICERRGLVLIPQYG